MQLPILFLWCVVSTSAAPQLFLHVPNLAEMLSAFQKEAQAAAPSEGPTPVAVDEASPQTKKESEVMQVLHAIEEAVKIRAATNELPLSGAKVDKDKVDVLETTTVKNDGTTAAVTEEVGQLSETVDTSKPSGQINEESLFVATTIDDKTAKESEPLVKEKPAVTDFDKIINTLGTSKGQDGNEKILTAEANVGQDIKETSKDVGSKPTLVASSEPVPVPAEEEVLVETETVPALEEIQISSQVGKEERAQEQVTVAQNESLPTEITNEKLPILEDTVPAAQEPPLKNFTAEPQISEDPPQEVATIQEQAPEVPLQKEKPAEASHGQDVSEVVQTTEELTKPITGNTEAKEVSAPESGTTEIQVSPEEETTTNVSLVQTLPEDISTHAPQLETSPEEVIRGNEPPTHTSPEEASSKVPLVETSPEDMLIVVPLFQMSPEGKISSNVFEPRSLSGEVTTTVVPPVQTSPEEETTTILPLIPTSLGEEQVPTTVLLVENSIGEENSTDLPITESISQSPSEATQPVGTVEETTLVTDPISDIVETISMMFTEDITTQSPISINETAPVEVEPVDNATPLVEEVNEAIVKTTEEVAKPEVGAATTSSQSEIFIEEQSPAQEPVQEVGEVKSTPLKEVSNAITQKDEAAKPKKPADEPISQGNIGKTLISNTIDSANQIDRRTNTAQHFGFNGPSFVKMLPHNTFMHRGVPTDPKTLVPPEYRNFIYYNDSPEVIAAKIAFFRIQAAISPPSQL